MSRFGSRVICSAKLVRRQRYKSDGYGTDKYWHEQAIQPREGIYIGMRHLSNGVRIWIGSEEGWSYEPREYITAALVVFNERENPMLVPLSALE